jgi:hypothetical protein
MMNIYINNGTEQLGPLSLDEVNSKAFMGEFSPSHLAWIDGWTEWQPLSCVPGFVPCLKSPSIKSQVLPPPISRPPGHTEYATVTVEPILFYIPVARLVVMSILTMSIYDAYWMYRNWLFLKQRDKLTIKPFWRAFFPVFFIHSLLRRIKEQSGSILIPARFSPNGLAGGWIIVAILVNVMARSSDFNVNLAGQIITGCSFLFLLPVQNYINRINETRPTRIAYCRWSGGQIALIVIGIVAWTGTLIVIYLPEEDIDVRSKTHLSDVAAEINRSTPAMIDQETELMNAVGYQGTLVYNYRLVRYSVDHVNLEKFAVSVKDRVGQSACTRTETREEFLKKGVILRYAYFDKDKRPIATIEVTPRDCGFWLGATGIESVTG